MIDKKYTHPHFRFYPSDARQRDLKTTGSFECKFRSRRYRISASRASRGILLVLSPLDAFAAYHVEKFVYYSLAQLVDCRQNVACIVRVTSPYIFRRYIRDRLDLRQSVEKISVSFCLNDFHETFHEARAKRRFIEQENSIYSVNYTINRNCKQNVLKALSNFYHSSTFYLITKYIFY